MTDFPLAPRSALYVPANNPRALAKLATLAADMLIVELEDAVPPGDKDTARLAAKEALAGDFGGSLKALRINAAGTPWHEGDLALAEQARVDFLVIPKVQNASQAAGVAQRTGHQVLAMIETAAAVIDAAGIARAPGVAGLIAGSNDIAADLGLPADAPREALILALQSIVLAARAAGGWALDGVCNAIDDADKLAAECRSGKAWGFDGKTLIHPAHIAVANSVFGPSEAEITEARAIVAAATGHDGVGAIRVGNRMVEDMHVRAAERVLARIG